MILDKNEEYSLDQAVTVDAASTNVIDHGAVRKAGSGNPVRIVGVVTEAFATLTGLTINLETDDNSGFTSATIKRGHTFTLAQLSLGKVLDLGILPSDMERYSRLGYDVLGSSATAGKITAHLASDIDTHDQNTFNN